jgi:hypothetical protein
MRTNTPIGSRMCTRPRPWVSCARSSPTCRSASLRRPASGSGAPAPGFRSDPASLASVPTTDAVMAVFGEQKRRGRWLVRNGLDAKAIFGSVELDLTEAVLEQRELSISATSIFGEIKLIVPDGVMVVNEGTAILGERNMSLSQDQPYTAETPIVHVHGFTLFGSVEARRPKKKWFKNR